MEQRCPQSQQLQWHRHSLKKKGRRSTFYTLLRQLFNSKAIEGTQRPQGFHTNRKGFLSLSSLPSSLYECQHISPTAPSHVSSTSLNFLMRALSGPGISENDRKNRELHKHAATKSDLILLSPISFRLEFQTAQRCVPCAMPLPCQSLSVGHCTHFEIINPKVFLSKQVFMSASTAVFIFPVFFHTGKLHYCHEGMRVPMCACAHAGVCNGVEA